MTVEQIDDFKGPLGELIGMLDRCILDARASKDYQKCVNLCGATRSAFMRVHKDCVLYPDIKSDLIDSFVQIFQTAIHHLDAIMADVPLDEVPRQHLAGMVSNIGFRVKQLEVLKEVAEPIEQRIERVEKLSKEMNKAQRNLRLTQGLAV